ncbi:hypothetical protein DCS_02694 [Drechmeria coniospora]|uniref:Uncharacterized protein n=1 Tax=Drechmeria coniospora TaxID=98403 RepID=A0A151GWZ3_DRECN|nr:hypothetical protein DCS_02694 [Drechmeria coniospora]KYK61552.1 hypothetical protein DCS_02694 [Drechmeria coniospora]ODA79811.1 hypothetical protein RJ55_05407 [Drechmeria coniospora]
MVVGTEVEMVIGAEVKMVIGTEVEMVVGTEVEMVIRNEVEMTTGSVAIQGIGNIGSAVRVQRTGIGRIDGDGPYGFNDGMRLVTGSKYKQDTRTQSCRNHHNVK